MTVAAFIQKNLFVFSFQQHKKFKCYCINYDAYSKNF